MTKSEKWRELRSSDFGFFWHSAFGFPRRRRLLQQPLTSAVRDTRPSNPPPIALLFNQKRRGTGAVQKLAQIRESGNFQGTNKKDTRLLASVPQSLRQVISFL